MDVRLPDLENRLYIRKKIGVAVIDTVPTTFCCHGNTCNFTPISKMLELVPKYSRMRNKKKLLFDGSVVGSGCWLAPVSDNNLSN